MHRRIHVRGRQRQHVCRRGDCANGLVVFAPADISSVGTLSITPPALPPTLALAATATTTLAATPPPPSPQLEPLTSCSVSPSKSGSSCRRPCSMGTYGQHPHVYLSLNAGCKTNDVNCTYFISRIVPSPHGGSGSATFTIYNVGLHGGPGIDPSVSWGQSYPQMSAYAESADQNGRTRICWRYANVQLLSISPSPPPTPPSNVLTFQMVSVGPRRPPPLLQCAARTLGPRASAHRPTRARWSPTSAHRSPARVRDQPEGGAQVLRAGVSSASPCTPAARRSRSRPRLQPQPAKSRRRPRVVVHLGQQ